MENQYISMSKALKLKKSFMKTVFLFEVDDF